MSRCVLECHLLLHLVKSFHVPRSHLMFLLLKMSSAFRIEAAALTFMMKSFFLFETKFEFKFDYCLGVWIQIPMMGLLAKESDEEKFVFHFKSLLVTERRFFIASYFGGSRCRFGWF
jgi:hypothetical protein